MEHTTELLYYAAGAALFALAAGLLFAVFRECGALSEVMREVLQRGDALHIRGV